MIVIDTNVLSEVLKPVPDPRVAGWLESLSGEVAISSITLAELLAGVALLPVGRRPSALEGAIRAAIEPFRRTRAILPFDDKAAEHYAIIVKAPRKAGAPISTPDAQIAAICRAHSASCATRNVGDFADTGVPLINPWDA